MNHPLAQPGKKVGVVDGPLSTDGFTGVSRVEKDQIEVRCITQLDAPQFAVSDDGKSAFAGLPVKGA
jgi:hypothetical protein